MIDDIRARLRGGLYDPLVAADVSLLLAEIERLRDVLVEVYLTASAPAEDIRATIDAALDEPRG